MNSKGLYGYVRAEWPKLALPVFSIALPLLGGLILCWSILDKMLCVDAESTSSTWVSMLIEKNPDVLNFFSGQTPSTATMQFLNETSQIGEIYRFRVWSGDGHLAYQSERMPSSGTPIEQARIREAFLSGSILNEVHKGSSPGNVRFYVQSFIPVKQNGSVAGVFEIYLDQSNDEVLYKQSLLFTEIIIGALALVAGGIPARSGYRRLVELQKAKAETLYVAQHDGLTGLPNRRMLDDLARAAFGMASKHLRKKQVAALIIDMDRFKDINDSFGHPAGDRLLKEVANRLNSHVAPGDYVARFGGDEFIVLQVGLYQPNGASALAQRLVEALLEPHEINGAQVICGASIGVAISPQDGEDLDELISCADAALHKAKVNRRGSVRFFEPGMDAKIKERNEIEVELRRAVAANSFQLAYQPVRSLGDGKLLGFEALLRWPEGLPPRSPADFVPIAEESGLINEIGIWVLETACRSAAKWPHHLKVAVNISPVQFCDGDLALVVRRALNNSGLDAERLELEVTESVWIQDKDWVLAQLGHLRKLGVSIALDDFGTGYSSLAYLWKFPFDTLKIDQSFVRQMETDPKVVAIVKTIAAMGRSMGLEVIAEGVERAAQAMILRDAGCDRAQGFLLGRPLPLALAEAMANADGESEEEGLDWRHEQAS